MQWSICFTEAALHLDLTSPSFLKTLLSGLSDKCKRQCQHNSVFYVLYMLTFADENWLKLQEAYICLWSEGEKANE